MPDTILLNSFRHATQNGLRKFLEDTSDNPDRLYIGTPENWAWLFFQLRAADDRPEWFPSGKWATLQRLESLLDDCMLPKESQPWQTNI